MVTGTATEVAGDGLADLVVGGVGILLQQCLRREEDPGRAESALQPVVVPERLLERMQALAVGEPLDRRQLGAVHLDGEQQAAPHGLAAEQDRAGSADAVLAADVGAREIEAVAQEVREARPRLDGALPRLTVDTQADRPRRHAGSLARPTASASARATSV